MEICHLEGFCDFPIQFLSLPIQTWSLSEAAPCNIFLLELHHVIEVLFCA